MRSLAQADTGLTYARARLWLGMIGVGTLTLLTALVPVLDLPYTLLPAETAATAADLRGLATLVAVWIAFMAPLDLLGGYLVPRAFGRAVPSAPTFLLRWARAVFLQGVLYVAAGLVLLAAGRAAGVPGALAALAGMMVLLTAAQGWLAGDGVGDVRRLAAEDEARLAVRLRGLGLDLPRLRVVVHDDPGFTGGIVGLPGREALWIPRRWRDVLDEDQLAVVVARRVVALQGGGRTRGVVFAMAWGVLGFGLAAQLPLAGVDSVAALATTACGYAAWTFLGLLLLPSLSRQAALAVDAEVVDRGVSRGALAAALGPLDALQDDEPERPALIETIFHPVPGVGRRDGSRGAGRAWAWHALRMNLFLSQVGLGLLARTVHCNVGRTELWQMLPTD